MKTFKKIYFYIFILVIFISGKAYAFDPVVMTCTEVMDDGSVTIYWNNPDMTGFQEFNIYRDDSPVPILLFTSNDINLISFHDDMVDAHMSRQSYFVDIVYQTETKKSSEISTIFLDLDNTTPGTSTLLWNSVQDPLPEGSLNYYKVYKSIYEAGMPYDWVMIGDNVQNTLFNYIIEDGVCNDSINFKVEIESTNGCTSVSNISGDWFSETNLPERPVFDSVSIQNNTNAIIGWQASISPDVVEYILYDIDESGVAVAFDRVSDLFYVDTRYNACNENRKYDIAAVDGCGNIGLRVQNPQRPILMYEIGYNICTQQDTLRWEQYINVEVENYFIWRKDADAEFILIDSLPMSESDTLIMMYIDDDVNPGTTYEYFIQAIFENGSSSSCSKTIENTTYKIPQYLYFANADVTEENEIDLLVDVDTSVFSCSWDIYRTDISSGSEDLFTSIDISDINNSPINLNDADADPQSTSYKYFAVAIDSCGISRIESNHLKTILLSGSRLDAETNHLEWNKFEGWETDIENYYVYRAIGEASDFVLIDLLENYELSYDDVIEPEMAVEGRFLYFVAAQQLTGGEFNYEAYSRSNIIALYFESQVFIPNAFRPGSTNIENNEFKPIFSYFSGSIYLFQIFNRWGQMVFETTDTEEGWNGLVNGQHQKSGIYVYRLSYKNIYGLEVDKKGTVLLLQ